MTLSFQSHIPKPDESRIFQYLMNLDWRKQNISIFDESRLSVWITSYCEKQSSKNWSVLTMARSDFSDLKNILKCL
jgi:hypothetical protein